MVKKQNIEGKQTIKIASSTVYMEEANYGCEEANYLDKRAFYNLKKSFQGLTSCERHKVSDSCMEAISMNACREQLVSGLSEELKGRDCLEWWIQKLSALGINIYTRVDHNYIRYRDLPELERRVEDEESGYDTDSTGHHHSSLLKVGSEIAGDPYLNPVADLESFTMGGKILNFRNEIHFNSRFEIL
ncbi:hypothetical protein Bca52824_051857 [Brassica carinata]|uniref:Uncharacterized protein n=1 Tax=Brassica carinata TaxID=52824 RepID=A0A8X7UJ48_BRACI|nr:hypothetical protein Bca52824_051857 [Brassica carinata]